ncbi:MAG: AMIN domain-containing protein [Desulfobacteraceae bacterium]|nr:AMIN domain-containing protein [Desulfobacteraceae bacterium]
MGVRKKQCSGFLAPWVPVGVLILIILFSQAVLASSKTDYHLAERCYLKLRNNKAKQKYRDSWKHCINSFLKVQKNDPKGAWASAGLYQAGKLYAQLYLRSGGKSDKLSAIDTFDRLIKQYPRSSYTKKARGEIKKLGPAKKTKSKSEKATLAARTNYKKAQVQYRLLQKKSSLRKYRDQWFKCIDSYRKAYELDSDGPLAAAALFGLAQSYEQLYKYSFLKDDRKQAQKAYKELYQRFPDSPYAQKTPARYKSVEKKDIAQKKNSNDAIAQVITRVSTPPALSKEPASEFSEKSPAIIEQLRFWSNPRYTRVVIDASQDSVFTYHELREDPAVNKPRRLYVDVHNSRMGSNLQKVIPINDNLLRNARAGQYSSDTVRVVVDTKSFKTFKIFSLKNPFRIVLDIWGDDKKSARVVRGPDIIKQKHNKSIPISAIVKQLALGVRRIVIDPGHGGRDYGASGYKKNVHEKDVVLQISKRLAKMINKELKCDVILTRDTDKYLSLEERTAMANTKNADLFISIHTNASKDKRAYGIETFILNLATDDEAIRVAARENATSTKNISDLDSILKDLMKNAKVSESSRLASYVQQGIHGQLKGKYKYIKNKGVKQAPFYVLLGAEMPSILVETSFISNARECKRLTINAYQTRLCKGIIKGIKRYLEEIKPLAFHTSGGPN